MIQMNKNYARLKDNYFFAEISKRTADYAARHPGQEIIRMGIGDVTLPLCPAIVEALKAAVEEQGQVKGFHGYGPECGYDFLKQAVCDSFSAQGLTVEPEEVFITEGAASSLAELLDLFSVENRALVLQPAYPAYVDANRMQGRPVLFLAATEQNNFLPLPDAHTEGELIYLCSPNNPTGAAYTRSQLQCWVDFANEHGSVILFDAAYRAFVQDNDCPKSIFEVPGARTCAIEINSLSKTAGFTGTRCGYTILPKQLVREGLSLREMWVRNRTTNYNGVSYIIQRGAQAAFSPEGQRQLQQNLAGYRQNARIITKTLEALGIWYCGGKNSPYIWLKCPRNMTGWEFFEALLSQAQVVGTPGEGFGTGGEGFFRLSAFASTAQTVAAMQRFAGCVVQLQKKLL